MQLRLLPLAVLVAAAACNNTRGEPPPASCDEATQRMADVARDMTAQFGAPCVDDDDCVIVRASGQCPVAGPFTLSDEAIAFSQVSAASEFVDDNASRMCPREECAFQTVDHFYVRAECNDQGACVGIAADPAELCGDMLTRVRNAADDARDALPRACSVDADCTKVTPVWSCAEFGHVVTGCAVVIAQGESIDAQVDAVLEERCIELPFECVIEPTDCGADVTPRCVESQCVR